KSSSSTSERKPLGKSWAAEEAIIFSRDGRARAGRAPPAALPARKQNPSTRPRRSPGSRANRAAAVPRQWRAASHYCLVRRDRNEREQNHLARDAAQTTCHL